MPRQWLTPGDEDSLGGVPRSLTCMALLLSACGSAPTVPAANEPTGTAEARPHDPGLVLGVRLAAGQYEIGPDGTLSSESGVFGRLESDGTLLREDGSVLARLAPDGTFAIAEPSRARGEPLAVRIEGDRLVVREGDGEPDVLVSIENGAIVRHGRREPVDGLTPDRYRTMLAAQAMMLLLLAESHPPMM
jgi:hypothetical protein